MKVFLAFTLAAVLGVAAGAAVAALRIAARPWQPDLADTTQTALAPATAGQAVARVVVDQEEHDFGAMDVSAEGLHDFVFTNAGRAVLELTPGETSCGCTVSELGQRTVAPGESGKVTVRWTPEGGTGTYRQTVTIGTNDPVRPKVRLIVSGRITRAVRLIPSEVVFGEVPIGEVASVDLRLLSGLDGPLELLGFKAADRETQKYYEVTFEPLSADQQEAAHSADGEMGNVENTGSIADIGEAEGTVRSYLLKVALKPGLPLGSFRQTILVQTNQESAPSVRIPISGTIVGDISIVGPGWDEQHRVLDLGTVSGSEGTIRRLVLVTRGPHSSEVRFTLIRALPELLDVDEEALSQTKAIGAGAVSQTPLVIRIPEGSPRANYLGAKLGEILIQTNHPRVPQLRLRVRFAIEG